MKYRVESKLKNADESYEAVTYEADEFELAWPDIYALMQAPSIESLCITSHASDGLVITTYHKMGTISEGIAAAIKLVSAGKLSNERFGKMLDAVEELREYQTEFNAFCEKRGVH